jgi:hypothetical protein
MGHVWNWLAVIFILLLPAGILVGLAGHFVRCLVKGNQHEELFVSAVMIVLCIVYFCTLCYIFS